MGTYLFTSASFGIRYIRLRFGGPGYRHCHSHRYRYRSRPADGAADRAVDEMDEVTGMTDSHSRHRGRDFSLPKGRAGQGRRDALSHCTVTSLRRDER